MAKFNWLRWFLYFVITMLGLEVLKAVITRIQFSANYLTIIIIICLQTLMAFGFLYYALFAAFFRRKLKRNRFLIYFSTSFVCIIILLEVLFTYWLHHPAVIPNGLKWPYKFYYDVYNFRIMQYEKDAIAFDDQLLYTLKPNAKIIFRNAEFNTPVIINKNGFRDDDASSAGPEIICLGDSFTMGWGVNESQSFPDILEKETGAKVLNTGTPSYGTARELMLLKRLDTSNLKYIIIQYCSNDLEENLSFLNNNYKLALTPASVFKSTMRSYELDRKYFPGKNLLLITQLLMKHQVNKIHPFFKLSGQPYSEEFDGREHAAAFLKILMRFREEYKNVKIIVTNVDASKYRDNEFIDELNRMIGDMDVEKRKDIIFVNTLKDLNSGDYFILDYHINSSGHRKVANKLLEVIRENPVTMPGK